MKEAKRPTLHLKQEKPTAEEAKAPEAPPPPAKPPNQLDVAEAFRLHGAFDSCHRPRRFCASCPTESDCRDYMISDIEAMFSATPARNLRCHTVRVLIATNPTLRREGVYIAGQIRDGATCWALADALV